MSRPFWHWQAGLEVAVDTARHQLDHAVRVEMKLATARARPGHHMPRFCSPGGLAARRAASPAHRSQTSYTKCATNACLSLVDLEAPGVEHIMTAWPRHAAMQPCTSGRAAVACRPRLAAFVADRRRIADFPLKTLQSLAPPPHRQSGAERCGALRGAFCVLCVYGVHARNTIPCTASLDAGCAARPAAGAQVMEARAESLGAVRDTC